MAEKDILEGLFKEGGFNDFRWITPRDIIVAQWVRMKCQFGCDGYGKTAACPPHVPSISECRLFFDEYRSAALFHFKKKFENPDDRHVWSKSLNRALQKLESEVFLSGYPKAFLLFMATCRLCETCAGNPEKCNHPKQARPTPEALGVDLFSTVRRLGYPIDVLSDYSESMNRYAILLIA